MRGVPLLLRLPTCDKLSLFHSTLSLTPESEPGCSFRRERNATPR
ncbi:hypothetical protein T261_4381 [Streptomyces lydicus]|nr:hypothetical protein T261_4381 [Streptomyces lydicus]